MSIQSLYDFSGGYASNIPNPLMNANELISALNCKWDNGLVQRNGFAKYSVDATDIDSNTIVGAVRTDISGTVEMILAVNESGTGITFWHGETTFTEIIGFTWSVSTNVRFATLGGYLVAVNGTGPPVVLTYDSGYSVETLDSVDERVRDDGDWHAVLYDDSESVYTNATSDAQDPSSPFTITAGDGGDGIVISCDLLFNKVLINGVTNGGSTTATYEYSTSTGWVEFTPTAAPVWTTDGDKELRFDMLEDGLMDADVILWQPYLETASYVTERYAIRITFTANAGIDATDIAVSMDQYLSVIMGGEFPTDVAVYSSRLVLASGNILNFAPVNAVSGWRSDEVEYFQDGGSSIRRILPFPEMLVVMKENVIYALTGNSYQTYAKRIVSYDGVYAPNSVVTIDQEVYFLARDGIRGWNGMQNLIISKHIAGDIPLDSGAVAVNYKGNYLITFPETGMALRFDPDTGRKRENGDACVSFYRYTNHAFTSLIYGKGNTDTGYLYGIHTSLGGVYRLDYGTTDNGTSVTMEMQTLYYTFRSGGEAKLYGRIKPELTPAGTYTLTIYAEDGSQTEEISIETGTTGIVYTEDISLPYHLDGKNISFKITHTGDSGGIRAIHVAYNKRGY